MTIRVVLVGLTLALAALRLPWWAVVAVDLLAYAIWAYTHPWRPCPRCKGTGTNAMSTKRRTGRCRRCKGTRQVKTLGAQMLHRIVRSAREGWTNRNKRSW